MLDITKYKWLDSSNIKYDNGNDEYIKGYLDYLDNNKMSNANKNIYGQFIFQYIENNKMLTDYNKQIKAFNSKDSFKKFKDKVKNNDIGSFTMSGLMIIMCGVMFIFFLSAIVFQKFIVNFSIDAIVGSIALVFLYRNFKLKYKLVNRYYSSNDLLYLDIISFILCILLKIMIRNVDLSLLILLISYYLAKTKFQKAM